MQASRWARRAIKLSWLVNREQRKSYPADYAPGEPLPEVEGLPILDKVNIVHSVNNEPVKDFSFKKEGVNTLTPLTVDDRPPHTPDNGYAAVLGMPASEAIEIWRSTGAPIIHLEPGVNCLDLGKLLARTDVSPEHLEAIKVWLQKQQCGELC